MSPEENALCQQAAEEMVNKLPGMELCLRPQTLLSVCGLLQLAQRHPHLPSSQRAVAEQVIAMVYEFFADCPATREIILRQGDDPSLDR